MSIEDRDRALTRAVAAWGTMRFAMEQAQPGMSYDCWFSVGNALTSIAANIEEARARAALQEPCA